MGIIIGLTVCSVVGVAGYVVLSRYFREQAKIRKARWERQGRN